MNAFLEYFTELVEKEAREEVEDTPMDNEKDIEYTIKWKLEEYAERLHNFLRAMND